MGDQVSVKRIEGQLCPVYMLAQVTLCDETGVRVELGGACPTHGGDACLREYVPLERAERAEEKLAERTEPIPMRLICPQCGKLHLDEGEFATKVHATHACQHCGMVWRPAVVPTVGVAFLPGFKNPRPPGG